MMGGIKYMVQWEEHPSHLATRLGQLLEHQTLVDVTLMCNTHTLRVHRAVLAACSPYFESILQRQLGMHPLIILKDMQFSVLKSLIEFMYCGETSVTEDNLSALLQAAKFFQVKGLSAMTKDILHLNNQTPKPAINGDAGKKVLAGRVTKKVGLQQQTAMTPAAKTLAVAGPSNTTHIVHTAPSDVKFVPGKTTFHVTPKTVLARPEVQQQIQQQQQQQQQEQQQQQQQQQTDTAQLLLSLSTSDFTKQSFHTVSKNVRLNPGGSSSAVKVEPARSLPVDSSMVKAKDLKFDSKDLRIGHQESKLESKNVKFESKNVNIELKDLQRIESKEVKIDPKCTNGGAKSILAGSLGNKFTGQLKDYKSTSENSRRRGRPVKRSSTGFVFKEKVMTDAEEVLLKEAEASRKAVETLRQQMEHELPGEGTAMKDGETSEKEFVEQTNTDISEEVVVCMEEETGHVVQQEGRCGIKVVSTEPTYPSRKIMSRPSNLVSKGPFTQTVTRLSNTQSGIAEGMKLKQELSKMTGVEAKKSDIVIDNTSSDTAVHENVIFQVQDGNIPADLSSMMHTEGLSTDNNMLYIQQCTESVEQEGVVYQVPDTEAGQQYLDVLKEAGLPSDVPILLDSGDGSYVSVSQEVLINIVNGGMIQVADGNVMSGDGLQLVVQELSEEQAESLHLQKGEHEEFEQQIAQLPVKQEELREEHPEETVGQLMSEESAQVDHGPELQEVEEINEQLVSRPPEVNEQLVRREAGNDAEQIEEETSFCPDDKQLIEEHPVSEETQEQTAELADQPVDVKESLSASVKVQKELAELAEEDRNVMMTYNEEVLSGFVMSDSDEVETEQFPTNEYQVGQDFIFQEDSTHDDAAQKHQPDDSEKVHVKEEEVVSHSAEMSVEQALEAMMGASDSEAENRRPTDSYDGETESLRLVLSPDTDELTDCDEPLPEDPKDLAVNRDMSDIESHQLETKDEDGVDMVDSGSNSGTVEQEKVAIKNVEVFTIEKVLEDQNTIEKVLEGENTIQKVLEENVSTIHKVLEDPEITVQKVLEEDENSECCSVANVSNISPTKDIPFAVGLLPVRTALEKLQNMAEHHPRKTRSGSKEVVQEASAAPAARIKRKRSSSTEVQEKKRKDDNTVVKTVDDECKQDEKNVVSVTGGEESGMNSF